MHRRDQQSDPAPFSLREKIMGFLIAASLVFTAWSFGGYDDLELHVFLLLSLLTIICSVIPFEPLPWSSRALFNIKQNLGRLLKLPFFGSVFSFSAIYSFKLLIPPSSRFMERIVGGWSRSRHH